MAKLHKILIDSLPSGNAQPLDVYFCNNKEIYVVDNNGIPKLMYEYNVKDILLEDNILTIKNNNNATKIIDLNTVIPTSVKNHIDNENIHVSLKDKENWNNKQDKLTTSKGIDIVDNVIINTFKQPFTILEEWISNGYEITITNNGNLNTTPTDKPDTPRQFVQSIAGQTYRIEANIYGLVTVTPVTPMIFEPPYLKSPNGNIWTVAITDEGELICSNAMRTELALDDLNKELTNQIDSKIAEVKDEILGGDFGTFQEQIDTINARLNDLAYVPLEIKSFGLDTANTFEKGQTIGALSFNWTYNKDVVSQSVNEVPVTKSARKYYLEQEFTENATFTLKARDEKQVEVSKAIDIKFYNGIYYGVSSGETISGDLILGLTRRLTENKATTFTIDCGATQNIFFAFPTRLGTAEFTVNGFTGGFDKLEPVLFTNLSGYSEQYTIYRSSNKNLGKTTVTVK